MKYAAGSVSGEWISVWAVSRFPLTAYDAAVRRLQMTGCECRRVRVISITDWEYDRAVAHLLRNDPYYDPYRIRFAEVPLSEREMNELFNPPRFPEAP